MTDQDICRLLTNVDNSSSSAIFQLLQCHNGPFKYHISKFGWSEGRERPTVQTVLMPIKLREGGESVCYNIIKTSFLAGLRPA